MAVASTDTTAPGMYWLNPSDGGTVTGRSTYVGFASNDDHAVKHVEVAIDGVGVASAQCDNISPDCQVSYKWTLRRVSGQHTATFTATDWMGNVSIQTVTFTVG